MVAKGTCLLKKNEEVPKTSGFSICDAIPCLRVMSPYFRVLYETFGMLPLKHIGEGISK